MEVIDVHGADPSANIIIEVVCMERSGWSMRVLLRFALLHSELLSLLEVSNGNHTAKQQGGKATLAEETANDFLLMNIEGQFIFSILTDYNKSTIFSFSISNICYTLFICSMFNKTTQN